MLPKSRNEGKGCAYENGGLVSSPASSPNGNILGHAPGGVVVTTAVETATGEVVTVTTVVIAVVVVLEVVVSEAVVAAAATALVVEVVILVSAVVGRMRAVGMFEILLYITALYIPITKVTAMMTQEVIVIICHLCFT